tara:strand:- start:1580 stop:2107 length:528 start_codon:yes stop_codon:yes gene_type:complete
MYIQKYLYKDQDLTKRRNLVLNLIFTLVFSLTGFFQIFISPAYSLGWQDEEWLKAGCPKNLSGNWIADNPVNKNLKLMSFTKREVTYTSQTDETQRFGIIKSSFTTENQFVKMKIKPLNNEKETIIKIRPHLVHIDSKGKKETSSCMIKVFRFNTEKHAQTDRYSGWNIFRLIKH